MKKLAKSKIFWFAVAYACIPAVALVFSLQVEHYECTLEDIRQEPKVNDIMADISLQDIGLEDVVTLVIYFEEKPTDNQIEQLEHLGITIRRNSWCPPVGAHPWGYYIAYSKVVDICRLIEVECITRVKSGETPYYPHSNFSE